MTIRALNSQASLSSAKPAGSSPWKRRSGLVIILTSALLIVLISAVQYYYTYRMIVLELEKNAERELTMKAILIKGTLSAIENALRDHSREVIQFANDPSAMYGVVQRLLRAQPNVVGAGIAFAPGYYSELDSLYEPWVYYRDGVADTLQLAGADHDYTRMEFYRGALSEGGVHWSAPYVDVKGGLGLITTTSLPIYDESGHAIAVLGVDVSLDWLGDTINYRHLYDSSFDILMTEDGRLIAAPSADEVRRADVESVVSMINDNSVARAPSESSVSTIIHYRTSDRHRARVFYAYMRGRPHWQIGVVCFDDEVFAMLNTIRWHIMLLTLLGMLLLGYIIYRSVRALNRLQQVSVEKALFSSELMVASKIQQQMLPELYPPFPERNDIDIFGTLHPAREVGGDLFDFFIRDEKLFFCIGDVSGKGVPSALLMAMTHALFRSVAAHESNPSRIMKSLNESSSANNESNMFVTLFIGVLDLPTGRLRYCNGGHDHPYVINGSSVVELPASANLPIGLFCDFDYQQQETRLSAGEILFLYTDGLTEARSPHKDLFGVASVRSSLLEIPVCDLTAEELLQQMSSRVRDFVGDAEQSDDLTMLAIRYTPTSERSLLHERLTLTNDVRDIDRLGSFIKSLSIRLCLERSLASNLRLALEEAVVNVMSYAYPKEAVGTVTIDANVFAPSGNSGFDSQHLCIKISDHGVAFDPTCADSADTSLSAEDRPIGGLGILLMRQLMDSINYEREDGLNILTLKKELTNNPIKTDDNENNN